MKHVVVHTRYASTARRESKLDLPGVRQSVPGVWSESLRRVGAQAGDGHDANAKVQALVADPRLLPLWMDKTRVKQTEQFKVALERRGFEKTDLFQSHLSPGPGHWKKGDPESSVKYTAQIIILTDGLIPACVKLSHHPKNKFPFVSFAGTNDS